jgi:hypothetical protein
MAKISTTGPSYTAGYEAGLEHAREQWRAAVAQIKAAAMEEALAFARDKWREAQRAA